MTKKGKNKKKLKSGIRYILKLLFYCLIIFCLCYYTRNIKIKNIFIKGNTLTKDVDIIEAANIEDYPPIYRLNKKKITKKLKELPLISNAKIKRNIFGKLTIEVKEENILFYYNYTEKYLLTNGESIADNGYYGYPILINFTPDTILEDFIKGLNKVDNNIIKLIDTIEYTPFTSDDGDIIDESNFTLKMKDQNRVVIDTVNIRKLNDYMKIYASLKMDENKGTLYLDTITDDNIYFKSYQTEKQEEEEKEAKEKEKEKEQEKEE